jgi:DNA-binding response OmpR family regulator
MKKILVVEDDPTVQNVLRCLFEAEHYTVEVASDGKSALGALRAELPSAVILDLRLPRMSGSEVCGKIKKNAPSLPVIVLSATAEVTDRVQLLELGADDYVPKPFSPREFLARVQAAIRRTTHMQALDVFSFGDISVDFGKMETYKGAQPVAMTAHQFKLLRFFVENSGRVIPRSELLHEVWGYRDYPVTRTVDNQIWKLRLKLEPKPRDPVHLLTVHGAGYKFLT